MADNRNAPDDFDWVPAEELEGRTPAVESKGKQPAAPVTTLYDIDQNPDFIEAGNIDLSRRPKVKTPDGKTATVLSTSFNIDGAEVLIPQVSDDGRILTPQEALVEYKRTGKHLGKFKSPAAATAYAEALHQQQEASLPEEFDWVPEEDINLGPMGAAVRGVTAGTQQLAGSVGTALEYAGGKTGIKSLKELGETVSDYWGKKAETNKLPEHLSGSVIDNPELLANSSWWAYNVANMVPSLAASIVPGTAAYKGIKGIQLLRKLKPEHLARLAKIGGAIAGGVVGGALEGTGTYEEVYKLSIEKGIPEAMARRSAESAAEVMTLASAGLNAIPLGRILGTHKAGAANRAKDFIGTGTAEAITEYLEEPTEVALMLDRGLITKEQAKEQLKQGVNVMGPAFVLGGGASQLGSRTTEAPAGVQTPSVEQGDIPAEDLLGAEQEPQQPPPGPPPGAPPAAVQQPQQPSTTPFQDQLRDKLAEVQRGLLLDEEPVAPAPTPAPTPEPAKVAPEDDFDWVPEAEVTGVAGVTPEPAAGTEVTTPAAPEKKSKLKPFDDARYKDKDFGVDKDVDAALDLVVRESGWFQQGGKGMGPNAMPAGVAAELGVEGVETTTSTQIPNSEWYAEMQRDKSIRVPGGQQGVEDLIAKIRNGEGLTAQEHRSAAFLMTKAKEYADETKQYSGLQEGAKFEDEEYGDLNGPEERIPYELIQLARRANRTVTDTILEKEGLTHEQIEKGLRGIIARAGLEEGAGKGGRKPGAEAEKKPAAAAGEVRGLETAGAKVPEAAADTGDKGLGLEVPEGSKTAEQAAIDEEKRKQAIEAEKFGLTPETKPATTQAETKAKQQGLDLTPAEEKPHAEAVRSDQGQAQEEGPAVQRGEETGGEDLQREAPGEPGGPAQEAVDTSPEAIRKLRRKDKDFAKAYKEIEDDPHPESGPAAQFMRGWLEGKAGKPLDVSKLGKPGALKKDGTPIFNPSDSYRTGWESAHGGTRRFRVGDNIELLNGAERGPGTADIDEAAHEAATSPENDLAQPTPAQIEAGNYKKGKLSLHGLDISIENPVGSERSGVTKAGKPWKRTLKHHYGYIKRTEGKDGDQVDVFIGPNPESEAVFIINQNEPTTGKFDEHKVMLGFLDEKAAKNAYRANYQIGWKGLGSIHTLTLDDFKTWLKGDTTQPYSAKIPTAKEKEDGKDEAVGKGADQGQGRDDEMLRQDAGRDIGHGQQAQRRDEVAVGQGGEGLLTDEQKAEIEGQVQAMDLPTLEAFIKEASTTSQQRYDIAAHELEKRKSAGVLFKEYRDAVADDQHLIDTATNTAGAFKDALILHFSKWHGAQMGAAAKAGDAVRAHGIDQLIKDSKAEDPEYFGDTFVDAMQLELLRKSRNIKKAAKAATTKAEPGGDRQENTGEALRRHWELELAKKGEKTDFKKFIEKIERATARADVFTVNLPAGATPGTQRYVDELRNRSIKTYKDILIREQFGYKSKYATWEKLVRQKDGDNEFFSKPALEYIKTVRDIAEAISGALTVADAAKRFTEFVSDNGDTLKKEFLTYVDYRDADSYFTPKAASETNTYLIRGRTTARIAKTEDQETPEGSNTKALRRPGIDLGNIGRKGLKDVRQAKDVTSHKLKSALGFADITLGEYVTAKEGQDHINYSFDAFHSLAETVGFPSNGVSLGGTLHFAVGALGHGKHAAHYAPAHPKVTGGTVTVINVTKTRGDGTVAHEWGHALDYFLRTPAARMRDGQMQDAVKTFVYKYLIAGYGPWRIEEAKKRIEGLLKGNSYYKGMKSDPIRNARTWLEYQIMYLRSGGSAYDGKTKYFTAAEELSEGTDYWKRPTELWARAFEAYVYDKMQAKQASDDYLVTSWVGDGVTNKKSGYRGTPYPEGEERKFFNQMFDAFFKALKWTDEGPVVGDTTELDKPWKDYLETLQDLDRNAQDMLRQMKEDEEAVKRKAVEDKKAKEDEQAQKMAAVLAEAAKPKEPDAIKTLQNMGDSDIDNMLDAVAAELQESKADEFNSAEPQPDAAAVPPLSPSYRLAETIVEKHLVARKPLDWRALFELADKAFGGTQAEGTYTPKDAYDAAEMAVSLFVQKYPKLVDFQFPDATITQMQGLMARLPTQTRRTEEQQDYQQFSTPPPLAFVAAWAAGIRPMEVVLEPSAGTGGIATFARAAGGSVAVNELAQRRAELLKELGFSPVYVEDALHLNNVLPPDVKPTVIVMNPPFSSSAAQNLKDRETGAKHIKQALKRLEPGGRLVAITGRGMALDRPAYAGWWRDIKQEYYVRANIGIEGTEYTKYGTSFDVQIIVIDKRPPGGKDIITGQVSKVSDLPAMLEGIRNERASTGQQPSAESGVQAPVGEGKGAAEPAVSVLPPTDVAGTQPGGERPAGAKTGAAGTDDRGADRRPAGDVKTGAGGRGAGAGAGPATGPVTSPGGAATGPGSAQPAHGVGSRVSHGVADLAKKFAEHGFKATDETLTGLTELFGGKGTLKSFPAGFDPETYAKAKPHFEAALREAVEAGRTIKELFRALIEAFGEGIKPYLKVFAQEVRDRENAVVDGKPTDGGKDVVVKTVQEGEKEELTDAVYDSYKPTYTIPGAKPHPGVLVESAAMGSVKLPKNITYQPKLPDAVLEKGLLSDAQIEAVILAGNAHSQMLPHLEGQPEFRRGFLIGDGTGVGKGREIGGIILDNLQQGRKKAVWISKNWDLFPDAQRDWAGVGQNKKQIVAHKDTKANTTIKAGNGILFTTYGMIQDGGSPQKDRKYELKKKEALEKEGKVLPERKDRVKQIVEWLGADFDGVIVFDEAHAMGNNMDIEGSRGKKGASATALGGLELQRLLPKARVVYVTATSATEVSNLGYMERLGLWGRGTAFGTKQDFVGKIEAGGVASMEQVAMNMKALGYTIARSLSYADVTYGELKHDLEPHQADIYNELARAWQIILQNIQAALGEDQTGAGKDPMAKSRAMSAFWSNQLRFFNQIITAMQMPSALKSIEEDIANGHSVVLQLVNTNEAQMERALAKMSEEGGELDDFDMTPRETLVQMLMKAYPVQQYEKYTDMDGNERWRPVIDSQGNPVLNAEAVAMRDKLVKSVASIRVPDGPLEMLFNHFGSDKVAEMTGRGRRIVRDKDSKAKEETLSDIQKMKDVQSFLNDEKQILLFSDKGGTGKSYHASLDEKNQRKRIHYLIQPGWRAQNAVQGFGRTHRTNQKQAPHYILVTTNLKAQRRFLSSIARRLDQLGALTKGQRQTGGQGIFSAEYNLETNYSTEAVYLFIKDAIAGNVAGIDMNFLENKMGLTGLLDKDKKLNQSKIPTIQKLLNRILSLEINDMDRVFDEFWSRLETVVETARLNGTFDAGIENIKAESVKIAHEEAVYEEPNTGAEARYIKLELSEAQKFNTFEDVAQMSMGGLTKLLFFAKNKRSGHIYAFLSAHDTTDKQGRVVQRYRRFGIKDRDFIPVHEARVDQYGNYEKIEDVLEARKLWDEQIAAADQMRHWEENLITGSVLPIWDRLPEGTEKIFRVQTDDGQRMIGRKIPASKLKDTLRNLGAKGAKLNLTPEQIVERINRGGQAVLSNNWRIKASIVSGEKRLEIMGPEYRDNDTLEAEGVFSEMISYRTRYFIPTGEKSLEVLKRVTEFRPVVEVITQGDASYSKRRGADGTGKVSEARVVKRIAPILESWKRSGLSVRVVQSVDDLPADVHAHLKQENMLNDTDGIYWRLTGDIYIIADALKSEGQAERVLFHEAVGHLGVERMFGSEMRHLLRDVYFVYGQKGLDEIARRYKLDLSSSNPDRIQARMVAASEKVAEIAEQVNSGKAGERAQNIWARFVSAVKQWLRDMGFRLRVSEEEIRSIVIESRRRLEQGLDASIHTRDGAMRSGAVADTYYSEMRNQLDLKLPNKGPAMTFAGMVKAFQTKGMFKAEELEWSGLLEWLADQKGTITKADVLAYVDANAVSVSEIVRGAGAENEDRAELVGLIDRLQAAGFHAMWDESVMTGEYDILIGFESINRERPNDQYLAEDNFRGMPDKMAAMAEQAQYLSSVLRDGGTEDIAEFEQFTLPGGENYRELLLTIPTDHDVRKAQLDAHKAAMVEKYGTEQWGKQATQAERDLAEKLSDGSKLRAPFSTSHFPGTPNILVHVRFKERVDADGKRVLFLEEVQSDWHQGGRKFGYAGELTKEHAQKLGYSVYRTKSNLGTEAYFVDGPDLPRAAIPNYGFDTEEAAWEGLLHRMSRNTVPDAPFKTVWPILAVKRMIRWGAENGFDRIAWTTGQQQFDHYPYGDTETRAKRLAGMQGFYDKMLPAEVGKYIKKWGAKVGETKITTGIDVQGHIDPAGVDNEVSVHAFDITPQMQLSAMSGQAMFSKVRQDTQIENKKGLMLRALGLVGKGVVRPAAVTADTVNKTVDAALRIPFHLFGRVDEHGAWHQPEGTNRVREAIYRGIKGAEASANEHIPFFEPFMSAAKHGLIDRYGIPKEFIDLDDQRAAERRTLLMRAHEFLVGLSQENLSQDEAVILNDILTGQAVGNERMEGLAAPIRDAIDELSQMAVDIGLLSRDQYERNRGAYLHRSYLKYESELGGLQRKMELRATRQRRRIQGEQLKGRGIFVKLTQERLLKNTPMGWFGLAKKALKADPRLHKQEFILLDKLEAVGQGTVDALGMQDTGRKPKVLERVYWPAAEPLPAKYRDWENRGRFVVRDVQGPNLILWRDYTRPERERMGEVMDARYNIAKTFFLMSNDIATGRFFKNIAENDAWTYVGSDTPPNSTDARSLWGGRLLAYSDVDWVKVPETTISNTGGRKRYGALAGRYVRSEIWRDLAEIEAMQKNETWRKVMTFWKKNKTARNPVVHMNNVMSNLLLMDIADVRLTDLYEGVRSMVNKDEHYNDAVAHNAFGGNFAEEELRQDVMKPILEKMEAQVRAGKDFGGDLGDKYQFMADVLGGIWSWVKKVDNGMVRLYQIEDEVFRMATYVRYRALGVPADQAAQRARDQFLNYDIRAPWVNIARSTLLPFIGYTYRAVPVLARSIAQRPWKLAKYIIVAHILQSLIYAGLGIDDDEAEDEREGLRDTERGRSWMGLPRMIRMPMNDQYGNPIFLDIRRWIPASDVFDTGQNPAGIPAPFQFGGPLMMASEYYMNTVAYTGEHIWDPLVDSGTTKAKKIADWFYKSWAPSAPWMPESWYWEKIGKAIDFPWEDAPAVSAAGENFSVAEAVSSAFGVKMRGVNVEYGKISRLYELKEKSEAIKQAGKSIERQLSRGRITQSQYDAEIERLESQLKILEQKADDIEGR